jgi:hypothetical protein
MMGWNIGIASGFFSILEPSQPSRKYRLAANIDGIDRSLEFSWPDKG